MSAIVAAAIGAGGAIGGSLIGAHGAQSAAKTQAQAADQASQLQYQEFLQQQANLQPWLKAGTGALQQLTAGTKPGGQFAQTTYPAFTPTGMAKQALQPAAFQALTAEQAAATPGYQFAFDQGLQALQRSQAATGITGGGAAKAAEQYGQGLASTNYQQAYQNALATYGTNQAAAAGALGAQQGVYGTNYDVTQALRNEYYNRLAGLAGVGQTATSQLNQAGQNYAGNAANLLTSGAAAQAAGQMGAANAWAGGLGGLGNTAMNLYALNRIYGQPNLNNQLSGFGSAYTNQYGSALGGLLQP
jgi:hypothetical protein